MKSCVDKNYRPCKIVEFPINILFKGSRNVKVYLKLYSLNEIVSMYRAGSISILGTVSIPSPTYFQITRIASSILKRTTITDCSPWFVCIER